MNFADNLKKIRKDNNLSQEQLAEKLGISRQAVSKWESGQSYPEMDKVIQICQLFNVNMNDLINENIREVTENKESKEKTNKYINSFFDYITKVVDMFSSMKFKQIVLCLMEQVVIGFIIFCVISIIGSIGCGLISNLFKILPYKAYTYIFYVLKLVFVFLGSIVGVAVYLHIFKIRYLDYYEIVKVDESDNTEESNSVSEDKIEDKTDDKEDKVLENDNNEDKKNKIYLEKKREKVIIRDPEHTESSFIKAMMKVIIWCVKAVAAFFLFGSSMFVLALVFCLALSLAIFKSGLFFWGFFILLIGCTIMGILISELLFNFIFDRKFNKLRIFIVGLASVLLCGVGSGIATVSIKDFDVVEAEQELVVDKYTYDMNENFRIDYNNFYYTYYYLDQNIKYVEKDIDNIEIVVEHSKFIENRVYQPEEGFPVITLHYRENGEAVFKEIKKGIDAFNNKKILKYDPECTVYIYGRKENLDKIKNNIKNYDDLVDKLYKKIEKAEETSYDLQRKYNELLNYVENLENVKIVYDYNGNIIDVYEIVDNNEE